MEVIVLHRHLQMITSPHHQGTSHLQAKEVTKNTSNYHRGNTNKKFPTTPGEKNILPRLKTSLKPASQKIYISCDCEFVNLSRLNGKTGKGNAKIYSREMPPTYIYIKRYESLFFFYWKIKESHNSHISISLIIIFTIFSSYSSLRNQKSFNFNWNGENIERLGFNFKMSFWCHSLDPAV